MQAQTFIKIITQVRVFTCILKVNLCNLAHVGRHCFCEKSAVGNAFTWP